MKSSVYYGFLEDLSRKHKLVSHNDNDVHFYRGELEEFYFGLRNKVSFPALIAESFEVSFYDGNKVVETSFIVAKDYKGSDNWSGIHNALDLCCLIGDEFLRRMLYEDENGNICFNFEIVSAVPLLNDQHLYAGMRYTVRFTSSFEDYPDREMWRDL